jgi:hypothetical protein
MRRTLGDGIDQAAWHQAELGDDDRLRLIGSSGNWVISNVP